jgi:hypothetical protein
MQERTSENSLLPGTWVNKGERKGRRMTEERTVGFEPTASSLESWRSTNLSYVRADATLPNVSC